MKRGQNLDGYSLLVNSLMAYENKSEKTIKDLPILLLAVCHLNGVVGTASMHNVSLPILGVYLKISTMLAVKTIPKIQTINFFPASTLHRSLGSPLLSLLETETLSTQIWVALLYLLL